MKQERANAGGRGAKRWWALAIALALAAAGWVRFADLGRAATRSDEMNQLRYAEEGAGAAWKLWKNPPWFNQIPLMDGIPAVWCDWTGQGADIGAVRQPMALMGWATVALCAVWTWRRRGPAAGTLAAVWLGLLPFHVYHSREAYYYAPLMLFGAWMTLRAVDLAGKLGEGRVAKWREYVEWCVAALLTCLFHMSGWVATAGAWAWIAVAGWRGLAGKERSRHLIWMAGVAAALLAGTARWILRALHEVMGVQAGTGHHTGNPAGWVLARVVPVITGGVWAGSVLLALVVAAAAWVAWQRKNGKRAKDPALARLGWGAWGALLATGAYVAGIGGGVAKWAYFAVGTPIWIVWCCSVAEAFWRGFGKRARAWGMAATVAGVAGALGWGAWETTRLEGKPTPYRELATALDGALEEGDAAIVDRWYEPWNEMEVYAPEKAVAWFTVADEPYENYVGLRWRETTQRYFEEGRGLGFVRLTRNHEARMGLWTWPEKWFAHRTVVANEAGARLAKTGYAPMEEFYLSPSRVAVEVFWNTREETAEKVLSKGKREGVAFFGAGWRLVKPWQQGDWRDYRVLEGGAKGMLEVWRKAGAARERRRILVTGTGVGGEATVRAGRGGLMRFRPGEISTQVFEEPLAGGKNEMEVAVVEGPGGVAVLEVRVE